MIGRVPSRLLWQKVSTVNALSQYSTDAYPMYYQLVLNISPDRIIRREKTRIKKECPLPCRGGF